jgi:hypothetical protein
MLRSGNIGEGIRGLTKGRQATPHTISRPVREQPLQRIAEGQSFRNPRWSAFQHFSISASQPFVFLLNG